MKVLAKCSIQSIKTLLLLKWLWNEQMPVFECAFDDLTRFQVFQGSITIVYAMAELASVAVGVCHHGSVPERLAIVHFSFVNLLFVEDVRALTGNVTVLPLTIVLLSALDKEMSSSNLLSPLEVALKDVAIRVFDNAVPVQDSVDPLS